MWMILTFFITDLKLIFINHESEIILETIFEYSKMKFLSLFKDIFARALLYLTKLLF